MKKIPTMFERDWNGDKSRVVDAPHAECGWVFAGEGYPTQKIDGTCCRVEDGKLWKRRELRKGEAAPTGFVTADQDAETDKTVGWVLVGDGPEDRWHREAFGGGLEDGTYELVGPKIQGNPEGYDSHLLLEHGDIVLGDVPRTFAGLREYLTGADMEGIVFHHHDGRMAKVKLRDFGLRRPT